VDAVPFSIRRIDHVLLLVEGMDPALAFYQGVLGCKVESRLPQFAMVELAAGESRIDLVDIAVPEGQWACPAQAGRNLDHYCLDLGPAPEAVLRAHLGRHGVEIVEERREQGPRRAELSLYVCDPSGNVVELLTRRPDPA
jgi:catechol 2,3-dioxygenase-like lactoylglutathione lyase family enzyme